MRKTKPYIAHPFLRRQQLYIKEMRGVKAIAHEMHKLHKHSIKVTKFLRLWFMFNQSKRRRKNPTKRTINL
ncbi:hypothetical protein PUN28_015744 [Cardiocondyla obscurior]|uniref:Uncharacterized protein n=1 Tax=Cardiocondyla obscurior TaxID=286306 RepID=A0AAW2EUL1_9HYME